MLSDFCENTQGRAVFSPQTGLDGYVNATMEGPSCVRGTWKLHTIDSGFHVSWQNLRDGASLAAKATFSFFAVGY